MMARIASIYSKVLDKVEGLFKRDKRAGWIWVGIGEEPFKE